MYFRYEFVDQMVENVTESIQNALDIRDVHFVVPAGSPEQTAYPWHSVNAVILFLVEIHFVICNKKMDESLLFFNLSLSFTGSTFCETIFLRKVFYLVKNTHTHTFLNVHLKHQNIFPNYKNDRNKMNIFHVVVFVD